MSSLREQVTTRYLMSRDINRNNDRNNDRNNEGDNKNETKYQLTDEIKTNQLHAMMLSIVRSDNRVRNHTQVHNFVTSMMTKIVSITGVSAVENVERKQNVLHQQLRDNVVNAYLYANRKDMDDLVHIYLDEDLDEERVENEMSTVSYIAETICHVATYFIKMITANKKCDEKEVEQKVERDLVEPFENDE